MLSTRDRILLALQQADRSPVSGAYLAGRLGLTRASIWKHVQSLRADGFPIRPQKSGYSLTDAFDFSLLKGEASNGLRFWKVHYQFATVSTQTRAKHAAEQGAPEGNLWISEKQSSGRGRLERTWDSALGGLWMSLLLRPSIAPSRVPSLTLVGALALVEAIQTETGLPARLKWPNDVVVETPKGWRKVAGILTEMSAEVDRTRWVIIGVGVNVNNSLPKLLADRAISLKTVAGKTFSRAALLRSFLKNFGDSYRGFEKAGFESFRELYWRQYSRPDQPVKLRTSQGMVRGIARGVDGFGALVVESKRQTTRVWEGEIVL